MSDTTTQECIRCGFETDCIDGICQECALKQQPTAGEWTKKAREFADLTEENAKNKGLSFAEWAFCLSVKMHQACDNLDIAEAINKDLLEACDKVRDWLDTSSLQQILVHYTEDTRRHALIMGIATHLERLEAAIVKAKKEG